MFLHLLCHSVHGGRAPVQGGSCPEGSLSRGGSLSVGGLCRVGSLSRGVGALSRVVSVQGGLCQGDPPPHAVKSGSYASYWNSFLFSEISSKYGVSTPFPCCGGPSHGILDLSLKTFHAWERQANGKRSIVR